MNRNTLLVLLGVIACCLLGWRAYVDDRRLAEMSATLSGIRADTMALDRALQSALTASKADAAALRELATKQREALERLVVLESSKAPPTLAELRAAKPDVDATAVDAALKDADTTGRIHSIEFLTAREVLLRLGTPSMTLANGGVVTWIYKLDGFERLLRCEFVDGIVLAAYDR
jgi:hypothetical protein